MKHSLYQLKWVPLLSTKQNILPSQLLDIKVVRIAPLESHLRQRMTQMTLFFDADDTEVGAGCTTINVSYVRKSVLESKHLHKKTYVV